MKYKLFKILFMNDIILSIIIVTILAFIVFIISKLGFLQSKLFALVSRIDLHMLRTSKSIHDIRQYVDHKLEKIASDVVQY